MSNDNRYPQRPEDPRRRYNSNARRKKKKSFIIRRILLIALVVVVLATTIAFIVISVKNNKADNPPKTTSSGRSTSKPDDKKGNDKVKPVSTASILSTGDMLIHESLLSGASQGNGVYDFTKSFNYVKDIVSDADLAVCNLEVTFGGTAKKYSSFPLFNTPDTLADALKSAGFDLLLTANNHSYDSQAAGIKRTPQVIKEKDLLSIGTRTDKSQKPYLVKDVKGIKFGFLNYTYETAPDAQGRKALNGNFMTPEAGELVNSFNYDKLDQFYTDAKSKIDAMQKDGAEVIMLYLHWGTEYQITPNEDQKEIAKKMCDLGVDVLIGGHPHVIQPVETIKSEATGNKMVCLYSCGNALSNQRISMMGLKTGHTEDGIMFYTTFKKYSNGEVRLEKVDYIPTWVNIAQIGQKKIHQIIPLKNIMNTTDNLGLNAETAKNAKSSYERTQKLVGSGVDAFNQSASQEQKPTQKDAA
ncbi:MAG: CapA family protein [Oscillospiraceae bacterium]